MKNLALANLAIAKLKDLNVNSVLPHAWLFYGCEIATQLESAREFAAWMVCQQPQDKVACGVCKSCKLFAADVHPDFCCINNIREEKTESSSILVDDIRALNNFINGKPQLAAKKIALIYPAEKMNQQAANALLKSLEEPGADTVLILLTQHPALLLQTIVSRCVLLNFTADLSKPMVLEGQFQDFIADLQNMWLSKQSTPVEIIERWVKQWQGEVLYWFELVLADLSICKYTQDVSLTRFIPRDTGLAALQQALTLQQVWQMLTKVQHARYLLGTGFKPNLQLLLEDIVFI